LKPLAWLYDILRRLHRLPWRLGWRTVAALPVPVIVVGNVVVGGVGKTPTVIALVQALRERGYRPGVVSRGHGARRDASMPPLPVTAATAASLVGDEPMLLARRTGVPVWVGADRARTVHALCEANPQVDVVVSDDGLQHHGLQRAAQLIVFDARGAGNGMLLPAGPLREPMAAEAPPRSIVLYHAEQPATSWPGHCARRSLGGVWPLAAWWQRQSEGVPGQEGPLTLASLRQRRWRAAAGIGNPQAFFAMLESLGLSIERFPLPDHALLDPRPWPDDDLPLIVTEKDAVKLAPTAADAARIHVATLDFALPEACVEALLQMLPTHRTPQ
jgi:tetraacyldisaccharide 4'-kinase